MHINEIPLIVPIEPKILLAGESFEVSIDLRTNLDPKGLRGMFSLQSVLTGLGTVTFTYEASGNGGVSYVPGEDPILVDQSAPDPALEQFGAPLCGDLKIVATESSGLNPVTITSLYLNYS